MYWLSWFNYVTSKWTTLNTASQGLIYNYTHVNPDSVFDPSQQLMYRVMAQNGVGMGIEYSPTLTINPITEPTGMDTITVVSVYPQNITIKWPSLTPALNGGQTPFYYQVQWNNSGTL